MFLAYAMKRAKIFNENYSKKSLKQEFILLGVIAVFFVILSLSHINIYFNNIY